MRKKIWVFLLVPVIAIAVVLGIFLIKKNAAGEQAVNHVREQFQVNEDMAYEGMATTELVGGSGVTSIGMINEAFPIDTLTVGLEIEEVLITSGDMVTSETPIVKFTNESVEAAREELESLLRDADLAYRAGRIEYEQAKISAKYDYESTVLAGEQAEAVYQETIANLSDSVDRATEAYDEAANEIAEIEEALANGTYKSNYEAAKAEYDETYDQLVSLMEEWGISWSEVTGGGMSMNQNVSVLKSLYSVLESNYKALEEAEEAYVDTASGTSVTLQMLKLSLPELEENIASAKTNYETSLIQAKLTKETTLMEAELAEKNYKTDLEKAESDFENLKDAYEEAVENLEVFEKQMGKGYYYPTETGNVLRVSLREGREITGGSSLFTLSDAEEMTVTVSVDQSDIAKLKVGDSAIVQSEDYGIFQGEIISINPVSSSSSVSSITYTVTVELTGNYANLSANESVSVYFAVGGSDE